MAWEAPATVEASVMRWIKVVDPSTKRVEYRRGYYNWALRGWIVMLASGPASARRKPGAELMSQGWEPPA